MQRAGMVMTIALRAVYLFFIVLAGWAYPFVLSLLSQIRVCDPNLAANSTDADRELACTSLDPIVNACLMSSILSTLCIFLQMVVDCITSARGPMRYACGGSVEYGQGFLASLRMCVMITLLQSTASFLGVGILVRAVDPSRGPLRLHDNFSVVFAAGSFALISSILTMVDIGLRFAASRCKTENGHGLSTPLATESGPASTPRWRVNVHAGRRDSTQTVSESTADWRLAFSGD